MDLKKRDIHTQVKHLILTDYLAAWRGIILAGLSKTAQVRLPKGLPFHSRLVYVDGFSYKGQYLGDADNLLRGTASTDPTWGSPILGVQALDKAKQHARERFGFHVETAAILVERDRQNRADLLESLRAAGVSDRVVDNPRVLSPRDGEIVVLQADFRERYPEVIDLVNVAYTKSFVFLDPYGFPSIPYEMVRRFVALPHADVMINWPFLDVQRKQGRLNRCWEAVRNDATRDDLDASFGTDRWWEIGEQDCQNTAAEDQAGDWEGRLAEFYLRRLEAADPSVAVKHIRLSFPRGDRTIFYLYLTTHNPTGALTLNEVLDKADLSQYRLKWNRQQDKYVLRKLTAGQGSLFDTEPLKPPPPAADQHSVSIPDLAAGIERVWRDRLTTRKEVYRSLVNSDVYAGEIDRALTHLKKAGLAEFDSTKIDAPIRFVAKGGVP